MRTAQPASATTRGPDSGEPEARDKAPGAFRTTSEVAEDLDIPAHVLRFWESKFAQLSPMKRGGGRRYYRPADVALLRGIRVMLYDEGLTIKGLQKVFRERGPRHVVAVGEGVEVAAVVDDDAQESPAVQKAVLAPILQAAPHGTDRAALRAVIGALERVRDRLAAPR